MSKKPRRTKQGQRPAAAPSPIPPIFLPPPRTAPDHTASARELEDFARQYPEDREELLIEAADSWASAGDHDRALDIFDELLESDPEDPCMLECYRISALWRAELEPQARAASALLRPRLSPHDPAPWNFIAETFEVHDDLPAAMEWFTAGITHTLGPVPAPDSIAPDDHYIEQLFIGRHRVRRQLGEPHDDWDRLAHTLHETRLPLMRGRANPNLDELHSPARIDALASRDPEVWARELEHIDALAAARSACLRLTAVLFWPASEFPELLRRRLSFADLYGTDHATHLARVETALRRLSDEGITPLAAARASVRGYESHARDEHQNPESEGFPATYAAHLAEMGMATPWPPPRNAPCWCGSGRKYKKCCGNPATA
ncbi:SEC-C metal-binding domain-containing protein [Streptomyces sp. H27-D2]|uniref:SEC-C metal-binding domain-containing protein n=1 Tax=Streptomyces sp. H27-D2 TaxID=3046304 RepID=UPI002DB80095|nr:SEC-C metal-binding domain-containing protein [Streptomyces sp. H27-D2]MEC4018120.1 SEC-C metal-binding domain-containing protein [Streptomyces sp. H27-D2]